LILKHFKVSRVLHSLILGPKRIKTSSSRHSCIKILPEFVCLAVQLLQRLTLHL
jgi:hypothetical protein